MIEILYKQLGCHGKRDSLWSLAIDLDKIQVRPDLEGHAVELGVIPKPLKCQQTLRPVRLTVRTPGFHPGNRGSIPLRASNIMNMLEDIINFLTELIRWIAAIVILGMLILWYEGAFTQGCLQLLWKMS